MTKICWRRTRLAAACCAALAALTLGAAGEADLDRRHEPHLPRSSPGRIRRTATALERITAAENTPPSQATQRSR